jgi:hypothetical protein
MSDPASLAKQIKPAAIWVMVMSYITIWAKQKPRNDAV